MKFERGQSGNPAGRKPGTGKHQQFRKILEAKAPELIEKAISMALDGDVKMMQMCLDRVLPALRTVDTPIAIPDLQSADTLLEKAHGAINAIFSGDITVQDGLNIAQACSNIARVSETSEQEEQLAQLEDALRASKQPGGNMKLATVK